MKSIVSKVRGFTLIEILVVIGIIAILAAIVIIAINPAKQFAQARNTQRVSNVNTILNAIGQRLADNKGLFRTTTDVVCTAGMDIPATAVNQATAVDIASGGAVGTVDMRPCLVPIYIAEIPVDPSIGVPVPVGGGAYDTHYQVYKDSNGRVTILAPEAVNETAIPGSPAVTVTR